MKKEELIEIRNSLEDGEKHIKSLNLFFHGLRINNETVYQKIEPLLTDLVNILGLSKDIINTELFDLLGEELK